jgi:gliding motility-associated-like protein
MSVRIPKEVMTLSKRILAAILTVAGTASFAQLNVSVQNDLQALVDSLEGQGIRIENPVIECHDSGYGTFNYSGTALEVTEGVLLTSGSISNAVGPNTIQNSSFQQNTNGDGLLNATTNRGTFDACRLEFDIISSGDSIGFEYVFASEEYHEWVGSQFNDVFGIFISGPGIIGDASAGNEKNIALIPGTSTPVSINTVNSAVNIEYFQDNTGGQHIQYDANTRKMKAVSPVVPCQSYHIKVVIADASDRLFDSGIFLQKLNSNAVSLSAYTSIGIPQLVEGCNNGHVRFTRANADPLPLTINYYLQGSAINGTDYNAIGITDPGVPKQATIAGGATYVDVPITTIADGTTEGQESLLFIMGNATCPTIMGDTLEIPLMDELPASVSPLTPLICSGGNIQLTATGGTSYAWSGPGLSSYTSATPIASPASTTTYSVVITNGTCSRTIERTVTVVDISLSGIITRPLCNGQTNGAVNLTVSNGNAPYSFNWTGPGGLTATTEDLVNIGAGTYTVSVTDANGCVRTQSFNVTVPAPLSASTNTTILTYGQNIACNGTNTGSISLSVAGGTAPYSYAWTGPNGFTSTSQNLNNVVAGSYNVTVTDQNGCSVNLSRTLTEPPALTASIGNVTHVLCHGNNTGSATVTVAGGVPPYSINWNTNPAQNTATATGLTAGTKTVMITDGYGCTVSAMVVITQPSAPLVTSITNFTNLYQCQGQNNPHGWGTANTTGGTPPYTYSWNTIPAQFTQTATFNSAGNVTATVTDANGCIATSTVTVTAPAAPTSIYISQQTNNTCYGGSTGSATISITGGSNVQSVQWSTTPPQTGMTLINVPAGTYQVIAQHSNGCQSVANVTITEPPAIGTPQITASGSVQCFGESNGSATFQVSGGTAPYTHTLNSAPIGNSLTGYPAGTYTIVTTDANGCTAQGPVTITGPAAPLSAAITAFTNELCFGGDQGTASAQASGGTLPYTYSWNSSPVQTGPDATNLPAGTYTVTATDANGCTASANVTISGPLFAIDAAIEDLSHETCFGANDGSATVNAWGGSNSFSITWNSIPVQTGPTATGLAPGNYTVEISDNNGCDTPMSLPVVIEGAQQPLDHSITASNYNGWGTSCQGANDGWIDLSIDGGSQPYTHTWSDAQGLLSGDEDLADLTGGTFYVEITDALGCSIRDTVVLAAPGTLSLDIQVSQAGNGHNVSCSGSDDGSADLTITGGTSPYQIQWTSVQGFTSTIEDPTELAAGVYDLLVTDANGCTATAQITLTAPAPVTIASTLSAVNGGNVSCHGGSDGTIDLTIMGGNGGYMFQWNNDATTEDLVGLGAGNYSVLVTDSFGCEAMAQFTLTSPAQIDIDLQATAATSCAASNDGSIATAVSGGVQPYAYQWTGSNGFTSTQEDPTGLYSGTYWLTITDGNGCSNSANVVIGEPSPLNISITSTLYDGGYNIGCNGENSGKASVSVSGGTEPYAIAWSGPNGFNSSVEHILGLFAGTYYVIITDANGCTVSDSITLTEPDVLTIDPLVGDAGSGYQVSCAGNDGSIDIDVMGGTPEYFFSWNGPAGFGTMDQDLMDLLPGNYDLTVMDANGCTVQQSFDLIGPSPIAAQFVSTPNICPGGNAGSIDATVSGGTGSYSYEWSDANGIIGTQEDLSGLAGGTYQLIVMSDLGCSGTFTAMINDPAPLQTGAYVSFYGQYNLQCVGDSSGVIDLSPVGGTAPYQLNITGPDGFTSTSNSNPGLFAGEYTINIVDANGCTADSVITLTEPIDAIEATFDVSLYPSGTNVSCFGATDGWIEASVTGGGGTYEIYWRGPDSLEWDMSNIYNLPAGDYSYELVVIDANQCTFSTNITLTQPDSALTVSSILSDYDGFNVTCNDSQDGWIDASIAGGNGGYICTWTGPNGSSFNTPDINGIGGGGYYLSVTDINGCIAEQWVNVLAPEAVGAALSAADVSCFGADNGIVQADLYGGTGSYTHSWSGPVAADAPLYLNDVPAGTYCLTVTDTHGCSTQECIIVASPTILSATSTATAADCGSSNGGADVTVEGGIPPYSYDWSNGTISEDLSNVPAGNYSVSISDANGCIHQLQITIEGAPALLAQAMITDNACNGGTDGMIDLSILSGSAPFSIQWNNGSTEEDLQGIVAGAYQVNVTDANGCTWGSAYEVLENTSIEVDVEQSIYAHGHNISVQSANDGSIVITPTGGTAPYEIEWSNGMTGSSISGLAAGTYTVQITDANGCMTTRTIILTEPVELEMPNGYSPNGDGYNDAFIIHGLEAYPSNTFTVFNRWGNVVYDRLNYKNDWVGDNSTGEELPNGTYFVILTLKNGERTLQGYVDLRR